MSDLEQARVLLAAAGRDLAALRGMRDATVFADEIFGFHVQQAVEKLLKAWLALLNEVYPRTHDLSRLLQLLEKREALAGRFQELIEYNAYAVQFRYEDYEIDAEPLDREEALRRVEPLLEQVRRRLTEVEEA